MKNTLLIIFFGIGFYCMGQSDSMMINYQRSLPIADIVETLTECNCMILDMSGELNEKEEKLISRGQAILFGREFRELDSLFNHSNDLIQLYAFWGICTTYPDSLTEHHLEILNKKGTVRIYQQGTADFPTKRIVEIAEMMYKAVAQIKKENEMQIIVEKKISEFILKFASNPKTYENISFQDYHVYSTYIESSLEKTENSDVYSVMHVFKIRNNQGELGSFSARFKIDANLKIMIIEDEESNTVSCTPPRLDWWIEQFGRKLNDTEKNELGIK